MNKEVYWLPFGPENDLPVLDNMLKLAQMQIRYLGELHGNKCY